jgi:putative pyruvate formate lyase activating enzyme
MYQPSYIDLYQSGELQNRKEILAEMLTTCEVCPHCCKIDRTIENTGYCKSFNYAYVCSYCDHHGEEPPISGQNGSGTIFFGNCNMKCVFCQNSDISQQLVNPDSYACSKEQLARIMIELQDRGCHNINLVSPSHFVPQIVSAVDLAIPLGLKIPLVYNSNGYDRVETLRHLDGLIDIYMPDLKYADNQMARKYSSISDYVNTARRALKEMYSQVGPLETNSHGIALRGLLVRHLVLPNSISGSVECLHWIANELSSNVTLSLMAQYYPANKAEKISKLSRSLTFQEYYNVLRVMKELGFVNALYQEIRSANHYRPDFNDKEDPFR